MPINTLSQYDRPPALPPVGVGANQQPAAGTAADLGQTLPSLLNNPKAFQYGTPLPEAANSASQFEKPPVRPQPLFSPDTPFATSGGALPLPSSTSAGMFGLSANPRVSGFTQSGQLGDGVSFSTGLQLPRSALGGVPDAVFGNGNLPQLQSVVTATVTDGRTTGTANLTKTPGTDSYSLSVANTQPNSNGGQTASGIGLSVTAPNSGPATVGVNVSMSSTNQVPGGTRTDGLSAGLTVRDSSTTVNVGASQSYRVKEGGANVVTNDSAGLRVVTNSAGAAATLEGSTATVRTVGRSVTNENAGATIGISPNGTVTAGATASYNSRIFDQEGQASWTIAQGQLNLASQLGLTLSVSREQRLAGDVNSLFRGNLVLPDIGKSGVDLGFTYRPDGGEFFGAAVIDPATLDTAFLFGSGAVPQR